jgi:hypothetical protein
MKMAMKLNVNDVENLEFVVGVGERQTEITHP